jgi:hypothetical protein
VEHHFITLRVCVCVGVTENLSWLRSLIVGETLFSVPCRFVAKVRSLDPSYRDVVPWQPRGYKRKRQSDGQSTEPAKVASGPQGLRLYSSLLDEEEKVSAQKHDTDWTPVHPLTHCNNHLQGDTCAVNMLAVSNYTQDRQLPNFPFGWPILSTTSM